MTSREGSDGRSVGECSIHARHCGSGTGVFFLVQHLSVLLVYRSYSAYYPSLYLDINGEIDKMKNHSRPMFLSVKRYKKVEELYVKHQVPYEIARQRTTKGSYIRQDWY